MWTRSGIRSSGVADVLGVGQDVEEVAAGGEEDVELAAAAASIISGAVLPVSAGTSKPHCSASFAAFSVVHRLAARERRRVAAHLGAALDAGVAADRHQPAALAADEAAGEAEVDDRPHVVLAALVLGDAHAPDETRRARPAPSIRASSSISARGLPGEPLELGSQSVACSSSASASNPSCARR